MNYISGILGSFGASLFFALLFHVPRRTLISSSSIGAVSYLVYMLFVDFVGTAVGGAFAASVCIAALSELAARVQHAPAIIFTSVAVIPLVPGGALYETMFHIIQGDYIEAVSRGVDTILTAGCIALAIALVTSFSRSIHPPKRHHKPHSNESKAS